MLFSPSKISGKFHEFHLLIFTNMTDFGNNLLGLWLLNVFDINTIAGHVRAATLSKTKIFFQNGLTK